MANVLDRSKQIQILRALCEGNSIRATARLVGVSKDTVQKLLRIVGAHCKNYHERHVVNVEAKSVQADEIWSFVGCKEAQLYDDERGLGRGDVWTWTALDHDSKLIISYRVGNRDMANAEAFMLDLSERLSHRVQLTTDGLYMYFRAVEKAFKWNGVDYAMLIKIYGSNSAERRYSPAKVLGIEKNVIMGNPKEADISTSYVERQNLSMRMANRRFTRLTNAFSKKVEYHLYAVALYFMHYNYCRKHQTLTKAANGVHTTPAMAAKLTDHVWSISDLLDLLHGN